MTPLNKEVEFVTRTNALLNPLNPSPGVFYLGETGMEYRSNRGSGYIQIPWTSIQKVRVQLFFKGKYVRGFFIETNDNQTFEFVVSHAKETLRTMRKYLPRNIFVQNHHNFAQFFSWRK